MLIMTAFGRPETCALMPKLQLAAARMHTKPTSTKDSHTYERVHGWFFDMLHSSSNQVHKATETYYNNGV
jgi:hypothetical protein